MKANGIDSILTDLGITAAWMNTAGFLGYLPQGRPEFPLTMGAFLPPPLSYEARSPAADRAMIVYPGGFLLHTGLPNLGFSKAVRQFGPCWAKLEVPVWLDLIPADVTGAREMSRMADDLENVSAIQIELPVGFSLKEKLSLLEAARGEKPVLVCLQLYEATLDLITACRDKGVIGIVLTAPRGRLWQGDKLIEGRLYGPALLPQTAQRVAELAGCGLPIIAGCGVYAIADGEKLLATGAAAVQVDAALWN